LKKNAFFKAINAFLAVAGGYFCSRNGVHFLTNAGGLSTFIGVWSLVKTQSLYDINDSKVFEGAAAGIVSSINDPYSEYLDKSTWQDLKIRLDAKFGGIGVYICRMIRVD
jgi:carboxyl-terminal processing protease